MGYRESGDAGADDGHAFIVAAVAGQHRVVVGAAIGGVVAGFGAVAEDGSIYINKQSSRYLSEKEMNDIIFSQKNEIKRRISILRKGEPLPDIINKTVMLIDDGIAAVSTMRAAIMLCRKQGAKKIIAAAPVTGKDVAGQINELADELVILETPYNFRAVAQVYENWYDVSDEEAIDLLGRL